MQLLVNNLSEFGKVPVENAKVIGRLVSQKS